MPPVGLEPTTPGLQNQCYTFKLRRLVIVFQRVGLEPTSLMSKTTALPIKLPLTKKKNGADGI